MEIGKRRVLRGKLVAVGAAGVTLTAGVALGALGVAHRPRESPPPAPVLTTTTVVRTDLTTTATYNATVGFGAEQTVTGTGSGTITGLPPAGSVVRRGQPLYWVDDQPVVVFYGTTALFRTLGLPSGDTADRRTPSPTVTAAQRALQTAELQVGADEAALGQARSLEATDGRSTLLQAREQLSSDSAALAAARSELAADEGLGCPMASSSTVGSSSGSTGSAGNSGTGTTGGSGGTGSGGAAGGGSKTPNLRHEIASRSDAQDTTTSTLPDTGSADASNPGGASEGGTSQTTTTTTIPPAAPSVTGEADAGETTTTATVSGTVTPNGLDTTYFFEYGTTTAYGSSSPTIDAGSSTAPIEVSATLTGLAPDTTYLYALVATNADGRTTGVAETFTSAQSSCVEQRQTIRSDEEAVTEDTLALGADRVTSKSTVATDEHQLNADESTERADTQALEQVEQDAPRLDTTELRGSDVALVAQNLAALGYYDDQQAAGGSAAYTPALAAAVKKWQAAVGMSPTGTLAANQVVVTPGPVRVGTVAAHTGEPASSSVLSVSGTTKLITFTGTGDLHVGQNLAVSAPGGTSLSGRIITVAPSDNQLQVQASADDPEALPAGSAGVTVTTASHPGVLTVPVEALLALANGGYALQTPTHRLLPVRTGLISNDQVEVSGAGVHVGLRVVTTA